MEIVKRNYLILLLVLILFIFVSQQSIETKNQDNQQYVLNASQQQQKNVQMKQSLSVLDYCTNLEYFYQKSTSLTIQKKTIPLFESFSSSFIQESPSKQQQHPKLTQNTQNLIHKKVSSTITFKQGTFYQYFNYFSQKQISISIIYQLHQTTTQYRQANQAQDHQGDQGDQPLLQDNNNLHNDNKAVLQIFSQNKILIDITHSNLNQQRLEQDCTYVKNWSYYRCYYQWIDAYENWFLLEVYDLTTRQRVGQYQLMNVAYSDCTGFGIQNYWKFSGEKDFDGNSLGNANQPKKILEFDSKSGIMTFLLQYQQNNQNQQLQYAVYTLNVYKSERFIKLVAKVNDFQIKSKQQEIIGCNKMMVYAKQSKQIFINQNGTFKPYHINQFIQTSMLKVSEDSQVQIIDFLGANFFVFTLTREKLSFTGFLISGYSRYDVKYPTHLISSQQIKYFFDISRFLFIKSSKDLFCVIAQYNRQDSQKIIVDSQLFSELSSLSHQQLVNILQNFDNALAISVYQTSVYILTENKLIIYLINFNYNSSQLNFNDKNRENEMQQRLIFKKQNNLVIVGETILNNLNISQSLQFQPQQNIYRQIKLQITCKCLYNKMINPQNIKIKNKRQEYVCFSNNKNSKIRDPKIEQNQIEDQKAYKAQKTSNFQQDQKAYQGQKAFKGQKVQKDQKDQKVLKNNKIGINNQIMQYIQQQHHPNHKSQEIQSKNNKENQEKESSQNSKKQTRIIQYKQGNKVKGNCFTMTYISTIPCSLYPNHYNYDHY